MPWLCNYCTWVCDHSIDNPLLFDHKYTATTAIIAAAASALGTKFTRHLSNILHSTISHSANVQHCYRPTSGLCRTQRIYHWKQRNTKAATVCKLMSYLLLSDFNILHLNGSENIYQLAAELERAIYSLNSMHSLFSGPSKILIPHH